MIQKSSWKTTECMEKPPVNPWINWVTGCQINCADQGRLVNFKTWLLFFSNSSRQIQRFENHHHWWRKYFTQGINHHPILEGRCHHWLRYYIYISPPNCHRSNRVNDPGWSVFGRFRHVFGRNLGTTHQLSFRRGKKGGNAFPFQWHAIFKSDFYQLSSAMMTPASQKVL